MVASWHYYGTMDRLAYLVSLAQGSHYKSPYNDLLWILLCAVQDILHLLNLCYFKRWICILDTAMSSTASCEGFRVHHTLMDQLSLLCAWWLWTSLILFISVSPVVILTPWSWELPRVQCSVPYFQVLPHQTLACFSNSSAPSMLGISYSESLPFHLMVSVSDLASLLHSITLGPSYFINKILILHFLLVLFYNYRSWCSISLTDDSH